MGLFQKIVKQDAASVLQLPIREIAPNPNQPRRVFSPTELDELAQSIRELGILQPLTVRRTANGWELIAGERRLRAAALAGLETVPCLTRNVDEERSTLLALVENIQREDLDFWEEALALDHLIHVCGLTQSEVARRLGRSQSALSNKLRLLQLSDSILGALRDGGFTERHARALLVLPDNALRQTAADYLIAHRLSVAQTEEYVQALLTPKPHSAKPIYLIKDVRLFLNSIKKGLSVMNAAGIRAHCGREDTEDEILLTIHIPK